MKKPQEILIAAREKKGWTQTQLGERIGIGLRAVQKLEDGIFPKYKKESIIQIDTLLNTNLEQLIYEQSVPHGTVKTERNLDIKQEHIAQIIKKIREILDISQEQIAQKIGISKDLYLKVEKQQRSVTMLTWVLVFNYINELPDEDYNRVKHLLIETDTGDEELKFEEASSEYKMTATTLRDDPSSQYYFLLMEIKASVDVCVNRLAKLESKVYGTPIEKCIDDFNTDKIIQVKKYQNQ